MKRMLILLLFFMGTSCLHAMNRSVRSTRTMPAASLGIFKSPDYEPVQRITSKELALLEYSKKVVLPIHSFSVPQRSYIPATPHIEVFGKWAQRRLGIPAKYQVPIGLFRRMSQEESDRYGYAGVGALAHANVILLNQNGRVGRFLTEEKALRQGAVLRSILLHEAAHIRYGHPAERFALQNKHYKNRHYKQDEQLLLSRNQETVADRTALAAMDCWCCAIEAGCIKASYKTYEGRKILEKGYISREEVGQWAEKHELLCKRHAHINQPGAVVSRQEEEIVIGSTEGEKIVPLSGSIKARLLRAFID